MGFEPTTYRLKVGYSGLLSYRRICLWDFCFRFRFISLTSFLFNYIRSVIVIFSVTKAPRPIRTIIHCLQGSSPTVGRWEHICHSGKAVVGRWEHICHSGKAVVGHICHSGKAVVRRWEHFGFRCAFTHFGFEPLSLRFQSVLPIRRCRLLTTPCPEWITGFEPVLQTWQACVLTIEHYTHILSLQTDLNRHKLLTTQPYCRYTMKAKHKLPLWNFNVLQDFSLSPVADSNCYYPAENRKSHKPL